MQEKTKNKIIVIGFVIMLFLFFIINLIKKDEQISVTERRKLAQFPKVTFQTLSSGKFSQDFESYAIDQFVGRDSFRSIKATFSNYVLKQKDNNGLFLLNNSIYKMEYPLNKANVQKSASKINNVYKKYLQGMNVYFSIIPDKIYYLEKDYLKIEPSEIEKIIKSEIQNIKYIDITKSLKLEDYYNTDLHWKQENLQNVVSKIQNEMNLENTSNINYETKQMGNFYGAYYGQLGRKVSPDKLNILTNNTIENCITYNYETKKTEKVYDEEKFKTSSDKYDIYLSGATSLIQIENPNAKTKKELILFRDSFGSSLAPLLLENYKKITLVDLRYINSNILENYINFENQDVLFLYSSVVLNQNVFK